MAGRLSIGGQAVIEGVMMRSPKCIATAVRKANGKIVYRKTKISDRANKLSKIPFIRGTVSLFESLVVGIKELTFSAGQADESEEEISQKQAIFTTIISLVLGIGLFIVLPSLVSSFIMKGNKLISNLIEGGMRLVIFVTYIWVISLSKDIKRVYEYHGAEHKSIAAYEHFAELKPENAKRYTKLHPRCGTSFLLMVRLIAILVCSVADVFLPTPTSQLQRILTRVGLRIALMPIIAGISYELQRYTGKHLDNKFIKIIAFPGLALQRITTREPDLSQLEVAIVAIKVSLEETVDNATDISEETFEDSKNISESPNKIEA